MTTVQHEMPEFMHRIEPTPLSRLRRVEKDVRSPITPQRIRINLAARLQSKASASEVLISAESYRKHPASFAEAASDEVMLKGFRDPVIAYRLLGNNATRLLGDPPERGPGEATSIGAMVFGILGAPCAVVTLIGPLAVALGAGSLFGLAGLLTYLDRSVLRVPVLVLSTLAAVANLYTLWHAKQLRKDDKVPEQLKTMTTAEKQRTRFVLAASIVTLGIVAFEVVAHMLLH
jgi:hypothetical protein